MVRGTRIISLDEAVLYNDIVSRLTTLAEHFGYQPIIFPAIWEQETFVRKAGEEILGQMYTFMVKINILVYLPDLISRRKSNWLHGSSSLPTRTYD